MAVKNPITSALFPSVGAPAPSVVDSAVSTPQVAPAVAETATKGDLAMAGTPTIDQPVIATPPVFTSDVPTTMDATELAGATSDPTTLPVIPETRAFKMADGRFYNPATGVSGATEEEVLTVKPSGAGVDTTETTTTTETTAPDDDVTATLKALFPDSDTLVEQYSALRKSSGIEQDEADLAKITQEANDMQTVIDGIEDEVRAQAGGAADESFIAATVADRMRRLMPQINRINARFKTLSTNVENKKANITEQLGLSKEDIRNEQTDRSYVRQGVFDLLETFGSEAFKGASPELLTEIERRAGLPTGSLSGRVQTLAQQEALREAKKEETAAAKLDTEIVEANGRKLLINSQTGEVIRDVGSGKVTGGGSGGGGLSLGADGEVDLSKLSPEAQAIIAGTLNLSDLTPTVKGRIAGELTAAGYKPAKLGVSTQKDLATLDTASSLIDDVMAFNADGKLEGIGPIAGSISAAADAAFGTGSEEAKKVRALIGNIRGTISAARAGLALTATEIKQLDSYTPKLTDGSRTAMTKLALLKDFIATKKLKTFEFAAPQQVTKEQQAAIAGGGKTEEVSEDVANLRSKYNY